VSAVRRLPAATFIPLFEVLEWAACIDGRLEYIDWSRDLRGLRWARHRCRHDWALVLEVRTREELRENPPARVVTLEDAEPHLRPLTLRALAERLERSGAVLVVERDRTLTIRAARPSETTVRLGRLLHAAAPALLASVKGAGPIDPATLPDDELTLGGELLPSKLVGRAQS
jgi:hypothetical protein